MRYFKESILTMSESMTASLEILDNSILIKCHFYKDHRSLDRFQGYTNILLFQMKYRNLKPCDNTSFLVQHMFSTVINYFFYAAHTLNF